MSLITGFTRSEVIEVTGLSVDKLNYLEKTEWVIPSRVGLGKRPVLLYSWIQLIQLVVIKNFQGDLDNKSLKRLIDVIGAEDTINLVKRGNRHLLLADVRHGDSKTIMQWVDSNQSLSNLLKMFSQDSLENKDFIDMKKAPKKKAPPMRVITLDELIEELYINAEESSTVDAEDFKKRMERELSPAT